MTPEQEQALKCFARRCLAAAFDCTLDGADAQACATELGLIRADTATPVDCEHGFEGEPGDTVYRVVSWLSA